MRGVAETEGPNEASSLTPDRVEQELIEIESLIARLRARTVSLLLTAESMQLPLADGTRSLREWAASRLDVSPETSSTLTVTARRLAERPDLQASLAAGEITFDRVEVLARIPAEHRSESLGGLDIPGLRRVAGHHRRVSRQDEHAAHRSQHFVVQPNLDESIWDVYGRLDAYGGAVVSKTLTEEADLLGEFPEPTGIGYRRALALAKICEDRRPGTSITPLISVFVDDQAVEIEGAVVTGVGIIDRIACNGALEIIRTDAGRALSVGRRSRVISPALRRFVLHRDGGCTAEGCTSRYRLEPHHKIPWSEGGPTDVGNLTTLCWFHHHVVIHAMGYHIDDTRGPGRIRFVLPPRSHDPP